MGRSNTYFLSDLHLGAPYIVDTHEAERRVVAFLDSVKDDASSIFLLGDVLDYWFEYRYAVPRGFVRFFGKLAELSDSGVEIVWLIGNHDIWIFDYLPTEIGIRVVDGPVVRKINGRKFYLAHGDGLGRTPGSFMFLRSLFRNRFCQKLYSAIHPRWTIPFALKWSNHSRCNGEKPMQDTHPLLDNLVEYSLNCLSCYPDVDYFIYGHLHIVFDRVIYGRSRMVVLGEWLYTFSYAVFDGRTLEIKRFAY